MVDSLVGFFFAAYIPLAAAWSLAFGLLACRMFGVTSKGASFLLQVVVNGIACAFGWAALAVFWHRHCSAGACTFTTLDLADFAVALVALVGISGLLPFYLTKSLDAGVEWMRRGLKT